MKTLICTILTEENAHRMTEFLDSVLKHSSIPKEVFILDTRKNGRVYNDDIHKTIKQYSLFGVFMRRTGSNRLYHQKLLPNAIAEICGMMMNQSRYSVVLYIDMLIDFTIIDIAQLILETEVYGAVIPVIMDPNSGIVLHEAKPSLMDFHILEHFNVKSIEMGVPTKCFAIQNKLFKSFNQVLDDHHLNHAYDDCLFPYYLFAQNGIKFTVIPEIQVIDTLRG